MKKRQPGRERRKHRQGIFHNFISYASAAVVARNRDAIFLASCGNKDSYERIGKTK